MSEINTFTDEDTDDDSRDEPVWDEGFKVVNQSVVDGSYISLDGIRLPKGSIPRSKIVKLYKRDTIVNREIKKEIEDLFGLKPNVVAEDEDLKEGVKDILFGRDVDLYNSMRKASKGAFLDGMALIYLNYDNAKTLDSEPSTVSEVKQSGVIYRKDIQDYNIDKDITSDTFNEVNSWKVTVGFGQLTVHESRMIHVIFDTVYDDPWGISKIAPEFDSHMCRRIVVESAVSAFNQNAAGIRTFMLPENPTKKEMETLDKSIMDLNVRSDIRIPYGTKVDHPAPRLADPSTVLEHLMETSTALPYQILTGTQAGAVTGSETNLLIYYIEINKTRSGMINDMLMDKLLYLQEKGALPEGDFKLEWGDVLPPDILERSKAFYRMSMALVQLVDANIIDLEKAVDMLEEHFDSV